MKKPSAFFALMLMALMAGAAKQKSNYPEAWWKAVPREEAKSWEILPQDAKPGEVILSKRTELGIFSNFASTAVLIDGKSYASIEGFWQMMKYPEDAADERGKFPGLEWKYTRGQVGAMTSFEAKKAGDLADANMKKMGINWVTYRGQKLPYRVSEKGPHYQLIRRAMVAKLAQHQEVMRLLHATGDLVLRPDHNQGSDAPPAWKYYEIWMELRADLPKTLK